MKKFYLFIFSLIISLIPIDVYAQKPSEIFEYRTREYVIDAYHIDIVVNEDNTFDITENITAYYNVAKHGIYRTIPMRNEITRLDGTTSKNIAKLTDLKVSDKYKLKKEKGNYKIQIGSQYITLTESNDYEISYKYNLGKDPIEDADELYFNIIGTEWDTVIGNITFKITMPKEFDESKLGFASGYTGAVENENIYYEVNGNVITGGYEGILGANQALTVRLELPEEYFTGESKNINIFEYLAFGIPLGLLIISLLLWLLYGNDKKTIDVVQYYPPENINSLEAAFIYKGKVDSKDVVSLLVYLANKGYIKINEVDKSDSLFSAGSFKVTKLKGYYENDEHEKEFLNSMFTGNNTEVYSSVLPRKIGSTINKILKSANSKKVKENIFEKSSLKMASLLKAFCIIIAILMLGIPSIDSGDYYNVFIYIFLIAVYLPFYSILFSSKSPLITRIFLGAFIIPHSILMIGGMGSFTIFSSNVIYVYSVIVSIICIILILLLSKIMPKRNEYGKEMLSKINGFRTFLETVEKDKLEMLVMENPEYFYNILPYTYVLGISDKWIEKFESIAMVDPSWYEGTTSFNVNNFNSFVNNTTKNARTVVYTTSSGGSSRSGRSSSRSSGGGRSGGGSGGGGGGSW